MADNLDEEHLDNPKNTQSENSTDEITHTSDTEIVNPNQETKNMEVHHHAHHGHDKKTWKNYFWEFFMLFLAVFCGFLAELQLEHYIEHQREKIYINHLKQDLTQDSLSLSAYIKTSEKRSEILDSLLDILINKEISSKGNDLYYHARRLVRSPNHFPADAAILQLKNSGNLRLIKNSNLVRKIGIYENQSRELINAIEQTTGTTNKYLELIENYFNGKVFYNMLDAQNKINKPTNNPQLTTMEKDAINKLTIRLQFMKGGNLRNIMIANKLFKSCTNLQKLLDTEYK